MSHDTQTQSSRLIAGRYAVETTIGEGGVGSVYGVVDVSSGARLALKQLRANAGERAAALFDREYRTLAGLRHPCIVEVYDYGVDADGPYYTMELLRGRDLSGRAPLAWRTACVYLRDAASILGLLHARRLLHRDLSPRNLIAEGGRLKLIDFGALADFGVSVDVAGTPPYVPPEALESGRLDQRSDLFALGALGYWLIAGTHAYPARALNDLPRLWLQAPANVSMLVAANTNSGLEVPPPALDDLLAQLLRRDPKERIASTAELIDRLNAVAGLAPEASDDAVKGYLRSGVFVGRERELACVGEALTHARGGRGRVVLIEGDSGAGRTRLLGELALHARVAGAVTLSNDAALGRRPYSLAHSLLTQLQRAVPRTVDSHARPHAHVLAPLMAARTSASSTSDTAVGEGRAVLQNALLDVFAGVASAHFLTLVIDDLEFIDEESRALLNALAHRASELQLCLIASVAHDARRDASPAIASLRGAASTFRLDALTSHQTRELLRSVFGEVPYLDRLSERLHRSSAGNPGHCLELAQHLVDIGVAYYLEGNWHLPMELAATNLPPSRRAGLLSRLDQLPVAVRDVALAISVPHGPAWTIEHVACAAGISCSDAEERVAWLARERVLHERDDGYAFEHEDVREALCAELPPSVRRDIHTRVGSALASALARHDTALRLCACVHLIRARALARAYPLLKTALEDLVNEDPARIGLHAAAFEEVLLLLRDAGQDEFALCGPLGMLAVSGYFADRRYALRYGEQAMSALQRVLRSALAEKLRAFLGRRVSLFVALAVAAIGCWRRRDRCLSVQENVRLMLLAASTLAGTAAICMDPDRAGRYARCLAPFAAFGGDHAASFVRDFTVLMELQGRDRAARCVAALRALIARLEDPRPIRELTPQVRSSYYAGLHLPLGVFLVRRDDDDGLRVADKLEGFSPLYAMSADHLRANYYAAQGDLVNAQRARRRLEVHAVQLGSAWQAETWAPVDLINIALRMQDAAEMKRAVQELSRLSLEVPSLALQELYARVSYLVLRGRHAEAIALYAVANDPPYAMNGWLRTQGTLARAHNALGQHLRARELCLQALDGAAREERQYVVMNLGVEIELALAEAGLGHCQLAQQQLQTLLDEHARHRSRVTLGALHEARCRVSLLERDFASAREQLSAVQECYRALGVPTLIDRARILARELDELQDPGRTAAPEDEAQRFERLLQRDDAGGDRVQACLATVVDMYDVDEAMLVFATRFDRNVACAAAHAPDAEAVAWARRCLDALDLDAATVVTGSARDIGRTDALRVGDTQYGATPLLAARAGGEEPLAMLVLGSRSGGCQRIEAEISKVLAAHLAAALRAR